MTPTKYLKVFINNVQLRLKKLDRRKAWLAEKSGVDKSTLGRYLAEETPPGFEAICKIAEALHCEPWELLKPEGARDAIAETAGGQDKSTLVLAIVSLLPLLNESQLRGILGVAEAGATSRAPAAKAK